MKNIKITTFGIFILLLTANALAETAADPNKPGNTYAIIVGGIDKDPEQRQAHDKAVINFRKLLRDEADVPTERIKVLVDITSIARQNSQVSNAENIQKAIADTAKEVKPNDRFIFYYAGQANVLDSKLRFNLPGKDITHLELTAQFKNIKPAQMIIILDCPAAGLAVKSLTANNRIILCAARSDQPYSPRFSEFFLPALTNIEADIDGDEKISLLEAFTHTSKTIFDLYEQQNLLKTETPLLEDDGDGIPSQQPWQYKIEKNDGLAASKFFLLESSDNQE